MRYLSCEERGIGFVVSSLLASGFLSGEIAVGQHYEGDDVRRAITRSSDDNIRSNQPLLDSLREIAAAKLLI